MKVRKKECCMRDIRPLNQRRCFTCLNWDGTRTIYQAEKKIKCDDTDSANCRYWHQPKHGHDVCDQHNPIK